MLSVHASIGTNCFLPDPRARLEAKSSARAGKEGINRKEINTYILCVYIFPKMNSFPRHLRKDASLTKMSGNEFPLAGIFSMMHLAQRGARRGSFAAPWAPPSRHVGAGSTIASKAAQPYDHPGRAATSRNVKPGKMGRVGKSSMVPSPAGALLSAAGTERKNLFVCCDSERPPLKEKRTWK